MSAFEEESSSDEEITLLRKAVDVELPKNFDPTKVPENGTEYLHLVMYEAKRCKQWVTADIDANKIKEPTLKVDLIDNCEKAPQQMIPSIHWQKEKLKAFTDLRQFLEKHASENPTKYYNREVIEKIVDADIPTFEQINTCIQSTKLDILQYILNKLDEVEPGETIKYEHGVWLYAVLATIGKPLSPHTCHCFRELARKCSKIRSKLSANANEDSYTPLNLFICIVSRYFSQLDLAD
ncbi:gem-associated protein 2 [Onthophagus taurus]|uniref:gem-associated protein 2 n=1 Tax=Onthophagus taurus TaxID=166361 RepID=UPI000C207F73|nr:gem-associated protein 2 [Onthophagus taurus]